MPMIATDTSVKSIAQNLGLETGSKSLKSITNKQYQKRKAQSQVKIENEDDLILWCEDNKGSCEISHQLFCHSFQDIFLILIFTVFV